MEHSSRGGRGSVSPYFKSDSSSKLSDQEMDQDDNDNVFLEDSDEHHHHHHMTSGGYQQQQQRQHHITAYNIRASHAQSAPSGGHRHCSDSKSVSECSDQSQCESPLRRGESNDPFPVNKSQSSGQVHCKSSAAMVDPFQSEKEFIDYLLSLPSSANNKDSIDRSSPPHPPPIIVGSTPIATRADNASTMDGHTSDHEPPNIALLKPSKHQPPQPSSLSGTQSPKIGLDHLENLCKLMEQLGELREQNLKLQKRVQYLEEVRCLNEMRKDLKEALEMVNTSQQLQQASAGGTASNATVALRSSATDPSIGFHAFDYDGDLTGGDSERCHGIPLQPPLGSSAAGVRLSVVPKRAKGSVKLRKTISKQQRGRSQSMGDDELYRQFVPKDSGVTTVTAGCARKIKSAKVSKWSKVKEALKWERAQTLDHGSAAVVSSGGTTDARSSFYVDVDSGPLQVSRATITLTPPSSTKSSEVSPHGSTLLSSTDTLGYGDLAAATIKSTGPLVAFATSSGRGSFRDGSAGSAGRADVRDVHEALLMPMAFLTRESYLETSSDEDVDVADDHLGRKGRSLERDTDHKVYVRYSQSDKEAKKLSKGAWGKVKNIIQTRKDSLKRKHRKSGGEAEFQRSSNVSESELSIAADLLASDDLWTTADAGVYYSRQTPTAALTSNDHQLALDHPQQQHHQFKSKHSSSSSTYGGEDFGPVAVPPVADRSTKPTRKVKPQLTIQPPNAEDLLLLASEDDKSRFPSTVETGSSPTSPRKSKWTKVKSVFIGRREGELSQGGATVAHQHQRPLSVPASPTNLTSFTYDDLGILEDFLAEDKDWEERKRYHQGNEYGNYDNALALLQSILTEKQAETELIPYETKRHLEELQRNISHDFSKKLQEWEKLKTNYNPGKHQSHDSGHQGLGGHHQQQQTSITPQQHSPKLDRKGSGQKNRKGAKTAENVKGKEKFERDQKGLKQREKELQWLEKQLQKIEREKQRLAKERQKYLEREARLEKMKETMMKPSVKNEILVRTAAGEFRFEGISQTFTRKLYEWEEMRGIGPEVSTIALLDSTHAHQQPTAIPQRASSVKATSTSAANYEKLHQSPSCLNVDTLAPPLTKYGRLDRHRSRSESSVADIVNVQTSTTSLAPDDDEDDGGEMSGFDYDTLFADLSRANSEPDLARFGLPCRDMMGREPPYAIEVEELHIEEDIPCLDIPAFHVEEPVYSYAPSEVTRLIDSSSGSSDVEKEASDVAEAASRRTKMAVTAEAAIPEEGGATVSGGAATGRDDANFGQYLLDEDISLLETLTAKEEICRQLETDLENLDGKMKLMFQQHSEEIQKLRSQEGILKDMEVVHEETSTQKTIGSGNSGSNGGSHDNSMKQKQLIEQLKARIVELEMAGECLKREREDLEETFKKHTEHQGQLTQHLAARITELQQSSLTKKNSDDVATPERIASHSKKKEGVVKVQNLSAELLQQAKTLEQALQDRNSTIRQLQWELLQRDMSAIQLQGELEKVKEKSTARVFRSDSKLKKNHNRSWSSVDAAYNGSKNGDKKIEPGVPLQIHKISDSPEFAALPIELTKKVRELKTELMRLWSSGESANSVGSDPEESSSIRRKQNGNDSNNCETNDKELNFTPFTTGSYSTDKSSSVETVIMSPVKQDGGGSHHEISIVASPKTGHKKMQSASMAAPSTTKTSSNGDQEPPASTLTTRRVSDTSIPSELPTTPEFGRQQKRLKSRIAPRCSGETSNRSFDRETQPDTKPRISATATTQEKDPLITPTEMQPSSPMVSRIPSRICPLSPNTTPKLSTKTEHKETSSTPPGIIAPAVNYTISLKPKLSRAANVLEKPRRSVDEQRQNAQVAEEPANKSELGLIEASVTLPNPLKVSSSSPSQNEPSPVTSTVVAVMPLPRKQLVRSPALRESIGSQQQHQRRSPYNKPPQSASLHRQNAEDPGSSSDTDTEDSGGVTFTINIGSKSPAAVQRNEAKTDNAPREKKACAPVATAVSGSSGNGHNKGGDEGESEMCVTARIPLKRQDKMKEHTLETQITVIAACPPMSGLRSPGMQRSRMLQDLPKGGSAVGSIKSPPPSPSSALWRKMYPGNGDVGPAQLASSPMSSPGSFRSNKPPVVLTESKGYSPLSSPAMVSKMASSLLESSDISKTRELQIPEEEKLVAPETPVVKSRSTRKLKVPTAGKTSSPEGGTNMNIPAFATASPQPTSVVSTPTTTMAPQTPPPASLPMEFSPMTGRRLTKDPAPSVKNMIEKYNLKLAKDATVAPATVSLLRSPQLGLNRMRYGADSGGVKKSTSFTAAPSLIDTATSIRHQQPGGENGVGGSHVVKSASAGKIDGRLISFRQIPPMSPELPTKHGAISSAPPGAPGSPIVGIASRIPRCLKAICEQDTSEMMSTSKDSDIVSPNPTPNARLLNSDVTVEAQTNPENVTHCIPPNESSRSSPPPAEQRDDSNTRTHVATTRNSGTDSPGFHSPITGVRALQIRRAREEFLTKIPSLASSATSPVAERHAFATPDRSSHNVHAGSPTQHHAPSSPLMSHAYRQFGNRGPGSNFQTTDLSDSSNTPTTVPNQPSAAIRPKGILKATRYDIPMLQPEVPATTCRYDEPDVSCEITTNASGRIIKSASTGTVDETTMMSDLKKTTQDGGDGLSDDGSRTSDSSAQQSSHKSGLFNFKFRKAKLKQKRESQSFNTVKALCRQSLVVDLPPHTSGSAGEDDETPQSPVAVSTRSCPSSPELLPKQNVKSSWLTKPKILFKSK